MTMTLISTITVGAGGSANIQFTSIPQTFTDLQFLVSARTAQAAVTDDIYLTMSGDTTSSYSGKYLLGDGSATSSAFQPGAGNRMFVGSVSGANATASTFGNTIITIPNYADAINKSVTTNAVSENNATAVKQQILASLFSKTTAVTSVNFVTSAGANFMQYSTISLYGITKGSGGATVS